MRVHIYEFFARGGGSMPDCQKTAPTTFFLSPQLILQFYSGLSMVCFKANYIFSKFQRGSNVFQGGGGVHHFPGGLQLFPGGV